MRFSGFHYFFSPQILHLYQKFVQIDQLIRKCFLPWSNLTTYTEKSHQAFTSSNDVPIFSIDSLSQLNCFTIHLVTNTLSGLTFSNFSDLKSAVQDSFPPYLYPSVHIPSLLVPCDCHSHPSLLSCQAGWLYTLTWRQMSVIHNEL